MHVVPADEVTDLCHGAVDAFRDDPADLFIVAGCESIFDLFNEIRNRGFNGHFFKHARHISGSAAASSAASTAAAGVVFEDVELVKGRKLLAGLFGRSRGCTAGLAYAFREVLRALRGFHVCSAACDRAHELRDVRHRCRKQVAEINDRRSDRSKDWCECRCQAVFEQAQRAHNGIDRTVDRAAHLRKVRKALFNRIPETVNQCEYRSYTDAILDDVPQAALQRAGGSLH